MSVADLTESIKSAAAELGFELCGICRAVEPPGLGRFEQWLESGYAGEMSYFESRRKAYANPDHVLSGVRSLVLLGLAYDCNDQVSIDPGEGRVARYAWASPDYHDLIHDRLRALRRKFLQHAPSALVRGVVDTAPLLEREFATLAGLGWQGKNTLVLNKQLGSWFFLAALLTDQTLAYDAPTTDHCGTCTACLQACPTDAFVAPNLLDATRCISYLTIELRSPIPTELRKPMGDWLFGCDVCQDVCPWNMRSGRSSGSLPSEPFKVEDLKALFFLSEDEFRVRFRKTPLWRPKRRGLLRNAAIVLGNQRDLSAQQALEHGINDIDPLVRGAAAWALGQLRTEASRRSLTERLAAELDQTVQSEIRDALQLNSPTTT